MRIVFDVFVIDFERFQEEFVFRVTDGFDDESVVAGEVEKGTGFSWRAQFREDVFSCKG